MFGFSNGCITLVTLKLDGYITFARTEGMREDILKPLKTCLWHYDCKHSSDGTIGFTCRCVSGINRNPMLVFHTPYQAQRRTCIGVSQKVGD